jgi:hypothetical protein
MRAALRCAWQVPGAPCPNGASGGIKKPREIYRGRSVLRWLTWEDRPRHWDRTRRLLLAQALLDIGIGFLDWLRKR